MEDKKYELVPETIREFYRKPMYRIRALKDFSDVKKGDLGGYVESEDNLSQLGNCWIYDDSIVGLGSSVLNNAIVRGSSRIVNGSEISDNAIVENESVIDESSTVSDQSRVINSIVINSSDIMGKSVVNEKSLIEHGSSIRNATVGYGAYIKNGADIQFDVNSDGDYVVYKPALSTHLSFTASTKEDIWSCAPWATTAEKLRAYLIDDLIAEEDGEYLRWFDSIVAFHKNYFNIK